jgi:hypothetical protein
MTHNFTISITRQGAELSVGVLNNTFGVSPSVSINGDGRIIIEQTGAFPVARRHVSIGLLNSADGVNGSIIHTDEMPLSDDYIALLCLDGSDMASNYMNAVTVSIDVFPA